MSPFNKRSNQNFNFQTQQHLSMKIALLTYNLANAVFEETALNGQFRFGKRFPTILKNLGDWKKKYKLQVVAIQEIHGGCLKEDGKQTWTTKEIADQISEVLEMKYTLQGQTRDPTWMYKALYYNPSIFRFEAEETHWMKRPNRENEVINAHGTILHHLESKENVMFWNCHPNPDLASRLVYCEGMGDHMMNRLKENPEIIHIAMGDFNTLQQDAEPQYKVMRKYFQFLTDEVKQTFYGFPYDVDIKTGKVWTGKLDHVLVDQIHQKRISVEKTFVLEERELSDHWPLFCFVCIQSFNLK